MKIISREKAFRRRQPLLVEDYTETLSRESYFVTPFFGSLPESVDSNNPVLKVDREEPQAYFVEQPSQATVPAHYHDTNQFQVFLKGELMFGKQQVRPLSVHYAGGHTPYGPITTINEGAHYLTLRNKWDSGGKKMPEFREQLRNVRRRFHLINNIILPDILNLGAQKINREDWLTGEEDGLGVSVFALGDSAKTKLSMPVSGSGKYGLVMEGTLRVSGSTIGSEACIYISRFENPWFVAGNGGALILVAQFPPEPL